jgi:16S rRNA (cytosine967-C5)-methyltransferase
VGALGAKPGELIIDACACPGSKSFGAAIDMENKGEVRSFDLHKSKLSLISDGAKRLGIDIIGVAEGDARHQIPELLGAADRVLCDVPCSGFGVIAKKPELRYKDPAESAPLPDIQLAILKNCSRYVKAGGVLVYSTCTVFPEENEENIKRFLEAEPDFSLDGFEFGTLKQKKETLSLYPDTHRTDGFFVARMVKKNA